MRFDKVIIGAGLYGLYSAAICGQEKQTVLVLEYDPEPFMRATYINQARVHLGYHYPRSFSTAIKSRNYFDRFLNDYDFCIKRDFKKIYATSANFSWTDASQFKRFCQATDIKCISIDPGIYFKPGMCDGVFETDEYTYDAQILRDHFLDRISKHENVHIKYSTRITSIRQNGNDYDIQLQDGTLIKTQFLLNTTYGSVNQIHKLLGYDPFKIKYELCEIILCKVSSELANVGITLMDGPFFSVMPFGKTGLHSLTSVTFTPHITSYDSLPTFKCQKECPERNCSSAQLAHKYLKENLELEYHSSLFSIKPILQSSEVDDSRPTVIKTMNEFPKFISTLSGKINTVYDLDEVLL